MSSVIDFHSVFFNLKVKRKINSFSPERRENVVVYDGKFRLDMEVNLQLF